MSVDDKIKWLFLKRVYEDMEEEREQGFHVTELVYDCLKCIYYNKLYAEMAENTDIEDIDMISNMDEETMITLWIGKKLHEMPISNVVYDKNSRKILTGWFDYLHDGMVLMHEYPVRYEKDGIKIVGRIDEILEIDGELIITDKKTIRRAVSSPYEHHIRQVNMYSALLYAQDDIKINKGAILYIDVANRNVKAFTFNLEPDKDKILFEMEMKVRKVIKALEERKPPESVPTWYCKWCKWFAKCIKDGFNSNVHNDNGNSRLCEYM